jgi:hypothetical protein
MSMDHGRRRRGERSERPCVMPGMEGGGGWRPTNNLWEMFGAFIHVILLPYCFHTQAEKN